jgi:DNA (cytosine-5)-methyltransferase 1
MRSALRDTGYGVLPFRLRACCVGADHQRDRLFLLAELLDANGERPQGLDRTWKPQGHAGRATGDGRGGWPDGLSAPRICRGTDGVPHRVDRLRGLGNAVVPQVAQWIGERIMEARA